MTLMKILIISPYLPHPKCGHGAGVFIYGLIEHLMYKHQITLLSFCDEREMKLSDDVIKLPIECHFIFRSKGVQRNIFSNISLSILRLYQFLRSVILWQPYYVSKFRHRKMKRLILELTKERSYDIVQIEYTQMGQYVGYVKSGKTVLHELDVSFRPAFRRYKNSRSFFRRIIAYIEWCRWAKFEPRTARSFNTVLTVTDYDRMLLEWLTKKQDIYYFPHAFDIPNNIPDYNQRERQSLLFVGSYSHQPNIDAAIWLCKDIYPLLFKERPNTKLYIIGPHPPEQIMTYSRKYPLINVLGFVEDLTFYLNRCGIFLAPLRFGGGVKNKILQAMAHGIPVVTTKVGVEGIDGIGKDNILVGDTSDKLVDRILYLIDNPSSAATMGKLGQDIIRSRYSWDYVISRLSSIYESFG